LVIIEGATSRKGLRGVLQAGSPSRLPARGAVDGDHALEVLDRA